VLPISGVAPVKIAVVIAFTYPGLLEDLKTYWQSPINFGSNAVPPRVNVYTFPGAVFNEGWAQEECLDVQMVCTMNPNASIWVVEAKSDKVSDMLAAVNYATQTLRVDIVSMSWGDMDHAAYTKQYASFNSSNVCYCAASGDTYTVSWPSVLPNCIAVGGTSLLRCPSSTPNRIEYAWNGTGCGYSRTVPQPLYQQSIAGIAHSYRATPDVSMIGDPNTSVYVVYKGIWSGVGGTSASTPLFAGMLSLANQQRLNAKLSPLTTVGSTSSPYQVSKTAAPSNHVQTCLYKTANNKTDYGNIFYDVTVGTDFGSVGGKSTALTKYASGLGYDIATGLGSPTCNGLCAALSKL
jgi:subtilase family serine protease